MQDNVISMFDKKKKKDDSLSMTEQCFSFEDIMRMNTEKRDKMSDERKKANKSVIRSYRLKR